METIILKVSRDSLKKAKFILENGGVVGIPTETVYGLGAIGTDSNAIKKIFEVKGRPSDNPLIAHVHKDYDLEKLCYIEQDYVKKLIKKFMPGPLTLVMKSKGVVSEVATCGGDTLAIRMPKHKGCQKLLRLLDAPVVAPSANLSKHTSPTTANYVYDDLKGKISLILDGGRCKGGIESTVLDVTESTPRILRAGLITKEMITKVVGCCEIAKHLDTDKVKSPGVKYKHYKPKCETALFLMSEIDKAKDLYNEYIKDGKKPYIMCSNDISKEFLDYNLINLGKTDKEIASNLYDGLLKGEKIADIIIAIAMPDELGINLGIMNRLWKSCG